jgi:hypothetical protein
MRNALLTGIIMLALPVGAHAQTVGIGVRAGTLGLGAEASVRITNNLGVRAGFGVIPIEYEGEFSDVDYTITPTSPLANLGIDLYPLGGGFRIGGGLLFISEPTTLEGEYSGTVEIGGRTYTGSEVGTLTGLLDHGSMAPYVTIGFGRTMARGLGLFLDLGAAFLEEPAVSFTASGPAASNQQFQDDLRRHEQQAQEDANEYLRILPILSIGLRFGIF